MRHWFTSDQHFFHKNIIEYAHRPFKDVNEMNETMISKWNSLVLPADKVFIIGDFSFGTPADTIKVVDRLEGQKFLIRGNHDFKRLTPEYEKKFGWVKDLAEISVPDPEAHQGQQKIVLCHYAMRVWNKSHFGSWHLYGHSHGSLADDHNSLSLDVGVDCWDFAPVDYDTIKLRMKLKIFKPIDHHEPRSR